MRGTRLTQGSCDRVMNGRGVDRKWVAHRSGVGGSELQEPDWYGIGHRAAENCARASARLTNLPTGITVDRFVDAATAAGPLLTYKQFSGGARDMMLRVNIMCGAEATRAFLRAALELAIRKNVDRGHYQRLPPLCARYHAAQLARIANDTDLGADWLDLTDDLFQKEFGIVSLRLYVAASNLVDYHCGIPRSVILRGGLSKASRNLRVMMRLGGFRPYFQGHIHKFSLDTVNERGRDDFYRCCVELYALHPQVLGMFCSSWYYDPTLDVISPRLSYLRTTPVAGGALLVHVETGGEAIANATSKSLTRRRLYEAGEYTPKTYMFVWGRRDMETWASTHPRADA